MRTTLLDHWRPRIVAMSVLLLVCTGGSSAYGQVTRGSRAPTPVTLKAPGPPPTSLRVSQTCGPECVALEWVPPEGATHVTVERHLSANDPNPLIVRRYDGLTSLDPLGFSDPDALAGLPPLFPVRYRVVAHYPDKGPGAAEVEVRSTASNQSPQYGFKAELADVGKTIVFTWHSRIGRFARPARYQIAGESGARSSPAIPVPSSDKGGTKYEYRMTGVPPGRHMFAIVTTYSVSRPLDWDVTPEMLARPNFSSPLLTTDMQVLWATVPDCVLIYKRAPHALALTGPFPAETLAMSKLPSDISGGGLELGIVGFRNSRTSHNFKRNGEHLREVANVGYRPVQLNLSNAVLGTTPSEIISPGQTKSYVIDLGGAICAP